MPYLTNKKFSRTLCAYLKRSRERAKKVRKWGDPVFPRKLPKIRFWYR